MTLYLLYLHVGFAVEALTDVRTLKKRWAVVAHTETKQTQEL